MSNYDDYTPEQQEKIKAELEEYLKNKQSGDLKSSYDISEAPKMLQDVLDALGLHGEKEIIAHIKRRWPQLREMTIKEAETYPPGSKERELILEIADQWVMETKPVFGYKNTHPKADLLVEGSREPGLDIKPAPIDSRWQANLFKTDAEIEGESF